MGRQRFVLPSHLLLLILTTTPPALSYPIQEFNIDSESGSQSHKDEPCIRLDAALSLKNQTFLFSNGHFFKLDTNYTEIARDKTVLGSIDAALSFQGSTFYFKGTSNYQYSWLYGLQGPVDNEKNWGEKLNGGVTAAVNLDDKSALFFYHCRFYTYTDGKGLDGPFSLIDIGLPCDIDAAFMMRGENDNDENSKLALVKFNRMWYVLSNGTVEEPVDVNSEIKLSNLTICSEEDLREYGSHYYFPKGHTPKSRNSWKSKYWNSFQSESESEDADESLDEDIRRELSQLLEDWLENRYGKGEKYETSEEKVERGLKLQVVKAWLRKQVRDSQSAERYDSVSDKLFGTDSDENHELDDIRKEIRMLKRLNFELHLGKYRSLLGSRSESESEEQKREQAKEMREQEEEEVLEHLEYLREHKRHLLLKRDANNSLEEKDDSGSLEEDEEEDDGLEEVEGDEEARDGNTKKTNEDDKRNQNNRESNARQRNRRDFQDMWMDSGRKAQNYKKAEGAQNEPGLHGRRKRYIHWYGSWDRYNNEENEEDKYRKMRLLRKKGGLFDLTDFGDESGNEEKNEEDVYREMRQLRNHGHYLGGRDFDNESSNEEDKYLMLKRHRYRRQADRSVDSESSGGRSDTEIEEQRKEQSMENGLQLNKQTKEMSKQKEEQKGETLQQREERTKERREQELEQKWGDLQQEQEHNQENHNLRPRGKRRIHWYGSWEGDHDQQESTEVNEEDIYRMLRQKGKNKNYFGGGDFGEKNEEDKYLRMKLIRMLQSREKREIKRQNEDRGNGRGRQTQGGKSEQHMERNTRGGGAESQQKFNGNMRERQSHGINEGRRPQQHSIGTNKRDIYDRYMNHVRDSQVGKRQGRGRSEENNIYRLLNKESESQEQRHEQAAERRKEDWQQRRENFKQWVEDKLERFEQIQEREDERERRERQRESQQCSQKR